ncbi:hypothetical protein Purlil1_3235 [Purpureocillium lilacinum]|uniref:Uncharacterized protein n=1 Tax=Purpureocillium lilacinum TaxID=33203 RepID=A0ABR0C8M1_PURLI|nr:hypothetical protein Purlil1_3235 [Purpureocillium lilacinum]
MDGVSLSGSHNREPRRQGRALALLSDLPDHTAADITLQRACASEKLLHSIPVKTFPLGSAPQRADGEPKEASSTRSNAAWYDLVALVASRHDAQASRTFAAGHRLSDYTTGSSHALCGTHLRGESQLRRRVPWLRSRLTAGSWQGNAEFSDSRCSRSEDAPDPRLACLPGQSQADPTTRKAVPRIGRSGVRTPPPPPRRARLTQGRAGNGRTSAACSEKAESKRPPLGLGRPAGGRHGVRQKGVSADTHTAAVRRAVLAAGESKRPRDRETEIRGSSRGAMPVEAASSARAGQGCSDAGTTQPHLPVRNLGRQHAAGTSANARDRLRGLRRRTLLRCAAAAKSGPAQKSSHAESAMLLAGTKRDVRGGLTKA